MPKNSKKIQKEFERRLKQLNKTRNNFERAFTAGIISTEDITQAYAGLYLDIFTEFERLIENLFFGVLTGKINPNNSLVIKKVTIKPISEIESVVYGGKSYLDWLPYPDYTNKRASIYFTSGNPFSFLTATEKNKLASYHKIRNALAHKSKKTEREFNDVISGMTLLPIEQTPQGFLRNIPSRATRKTQLEIISSELNAIAAILCT